MVSDRQIDETQVECFRQRCETILDVRSPKEYSEDHIPGAINFPALDNSQHAEVGTLYRTSPFEARKVGAGMVLEKIQAFVKSPLIQQAPQSHGFLLYCARGGQRSGALATVLTQIGFPVFRLVRGYKTYRAYVNALLEKPLPQPVFILNGYSGSGKTGLLRNLQTDANILDLEGLAKHRGSVLGSLPDQHQPSQKQFETALVEVIRRFDPQLPTLVEGESRTIGLRRIPKNLWEQLKTGQSLWLDMPRSLRTQLILEEYAELKHADFLQKRLDPLRPYMPGEIFLAIKVAMRDGDWPTLVDLLLSYHYDPLYQRVKKTGSHLSLEVSSLDEAHDQLRGILAEASAPEAHRREATPSIG